MSTSEIFQCLLGVIGILGLFILNKLSKSVETATESIADLNASMRVIVEKTNRHDKEIDDMRARQDSSRDRLHTLANEINSINLKIYRD